MDGGDEEPPEQVEALLIAPNRGESETSRDARLHLDLELVGVLPSGERPSPLLPVGVRPPDLVLPAGSAGDVRHQGVS